MTDGSTAGAAPAVSQAGSTIAPDQPSILIVATVASTIAQFLVPFATHLRQLGWRAEAAASGASADGRLADAFDAVHELPISRSILDLPGLVRGERQIAHLLATTSPDIVHVHTPIASFLTRFAVRRLPPDRRPAIAYTAHGFHFFRGGSRLVNQVFITAERLAGRWTDRLIVINDEDEAAARRLRLVPARRLVRMPGIGLDTNRYARAAVAPDAMASVHAALGMPPATPFFVSVGELTANKRQKDAIAALGAMLHRDARLVLLGDGPMRLALERSVRDLGLEDRVVLAGVVGDVRPIVASAVGSVLNSRREGLARSVMESLSLEVPVVASTARGNPELVGEDGSIVEVGDIQGFADAMDWLIDHPVERAAMAGRGRRRMVERYDVRNLIQRHDELYATMLAERSARQSDGSAGTGPASRR